MTPQPSTTSSDPAFRAGIDLVAVADVAHALGRFGSRYSSRLFTSGEMADTSGEPLVQASGLAARLAAKEATLKVLRPVAETPLWTEIEVVKTPGGWCELRLSGRALVLAEQAHLGRWSVCLTHEGPMAAAVVVASVDEISGGGKCGGDHQDGTCPTCGTGERPIRAG